MTVAFNKKLFKIHASGEIGSYEVVVKDNGDNTATLLRISTKVLGGKGVETPTLISKGKNIGRANETTPLEQAILQAESKVSSQLDKGYVKDMPKAGDEVTNAAGFLPPMLAKSIEKVKGWNFPVYVQPKFDGHRMCAAILDGEVHLYSRTGKAIELEHIKSQLQQAYDESIWDGTTLDGEVYLHGETLQSISSLVKKPKPASMELNFHVYDIMKDVPYGERYNLLKNMFINLEAHSNLILTSTLTVTTDVMLSDIHSRWLQEGYEGTIIRHGDVGYQNKRSSSLLKKKDFIDGEFKVVGYKLGTPLVRGNFTYQVPVYTCVTDDGVQFECTAPGSMKEKHDLYEKGLDSDVGKKLTVKYFNLTPKGAPYLPVALRFREDI